MLLFYIRHTKNYLSTVQKVKHAKVKPCMQLSVTALVKISITSGCCSHIPPIPPNNPPFLYNKEISQNVSIYQQHSKTSVCIYLTHLGSVNLSLKRWYQSVSYCSLDILVFSDSLMICSAFLNTRTLSIHEQPTKPDKPLTRTYFWNVKSWDRR